MSTNKTNEGNKFQCPFCKHWYPQYYKPDPFHQRVEGLICYDCHLEEQDLRPQKSLMRSLRNYASKALSPKQYEIWDLHKNKCLTQKRIAEKKGTTQQNIQKILKTSNKKVVSLLRSSRGGKKLLHELGKLHPDGKFLCDVWDPKTGKLVDGVSFERKQRLGGDGEIRRRNEKGRAYYGFSADLPPQHKMGESADIDKAIRKEVESFGVLPQHQSDAYSVAWIAYLEGKNIHESLHDWYNQTFRQFTKGRDKLRKIPSKYHAWVELPEVDEDSISRKDGSSVNYNNY